MADLTRMYRRTTICKEPRGFTVLEILGDFGSLGFNWRTRNVRR